MRDSLHILLVDDNPDDRSLIIRTLRQEYANVRIREVTDERRLAEALAEGGFDLVITDYQLRWTDGIKVLSSVKSSLPDCPVIMFTATGSEEIAVEAVKSGLDDYVLKSAKHLVRLAAAVRIALERVGERQAVRVAEKHYRSLFKGVPVGLFCSTAEGRLLDVNPAMCEILGYESAGPLLAMDAALLFEKPGEKKRWIDSVEREGIVRNFETSLRRRDGMVIWTRNNARAVRDSSGRTIYYEGSVEDITAQKLAEERVRHEAGCTRALLRVASRLNANLEPGVVMDAVCEGTAGVLDVPATCVLLLDEKSGAIAPAASFGLPDEYREKFTPISRAYYEELTRKFGPVSNIEDVRQQAGIHNAGLLDAMDIRTIACAVMQWENRVLGCLEVITFGASRRFTGEELALLQGLADQAAQATINARFLKEADRRYRNLQALRAIDQAIIADLDLQPTLEVFLSQVTARLGVDATCVLLLNPQDQTLEYAASRGFCASSYECAQLSPDKDFTTQIILEKRSVFVPDISGDTSGRFRFLEDESFTAYYATPLIARGEVKGLLEIFNRTPLDMDPEWLDFLAALASQAAIAIDNAVMFSNLQRSNEELTLAYDETLKGLVRALELRDFETEDHSQRVTESSVKIARAFGMKGEELVHLYRGALLHDIGKIGISDSILHKESSLTEEEWEIMRLHPVYAMKIIMPITYLHPAKDIPYCHHEKWDGTGYPQGLKGDQIPLAARIFAVVDVWDALRSDRPYRPAWPEENALEYIREQAGKHFDPAVVETFQKIVCS